MTTPTLRAARGVCVRTTTRARGVLATLDPLRIALFLLMVVTISRIHQHLGLLGAVRPALILAGVAFVYALVKPSAVAGIRWLRHWPARVIVALGVLACLSGPFGISLGNSAKYIIENYSKTLIFAVLLMVAIRDARDLRTLVWGYVVGTAVLVWMSVFVFEMSSGALGPMRLNNLQTWDANDLGLILLIGLALTMLTFQTSTGGWKWLSGALLGAIGVSLARSGSRGAFLGFMAVGLMFVLSEKSLSWIKRVTMIGITGAALLVAAPPGYWSQMNTLADVTEDYNWDSWGGRRKTALRGLGYMLDRPLFGIGINNFGRAEGTISDRAQDAQPDDPWVPWRAAHNSYVQIGAELGLPGMILWTWLVVGCVIGTHRFRRRLPSTWRRGDPDERFLYAASYYLPLAMVGFGVSAAFLSFAYLDPVYILAAFTVGLYVSVEVKLRGRPVRSASRGRRRARMA